MLRYRLRVRLRRDTKATNAPKRTIHFEPKTYVLFAFVVVLAILFARGTDRPVPGTDVTETKRSLLVSTYVLVVGFWWILYQTRKAAVSERLLVDNQTSELVTSFRSVFRIRPTVFSALEEANRKIGAPVGAAVSHAVTTFYVTAIPHRAFGELRERVQNPYLEQFVYILERGEDAPSAEVGPGEDTSAALARALICLTGLTGPAWW